MATLVGIRIKNFKAVGEAPVELKLAPITLLYGPNGAGKSTILHALHYAREILERGNLDPDRTLAGGELDFGGYHNLVHARAYREREIVLGFDLDLLDDGLPSFGIAGDEREDMRLVGRLKSLDVAEAVSLEITIGWSRERHIPYVRRWAVSLDGEPFAALSATDPMNVAFSDLNTNHAFLNDWDDESLTAEDRASAASLDTILFGEEGSGALGAYGTEGALPILDQPLSLEVLYRGSADDFFAIPDDPEAAIRLREQAHQAALAERAAILYVSRVVVGAGQLLRDALRRLLYIGPLRTLPPRDFTPVRSPDRTRWASGLAAWDRLHSIEQPRLFVEVSHWLTERLRSGFRLHHREVRESERGDPLDVLIRRGPLLDDLENIPEAYRGLRRRHEISLFDVRRNVPVQPHDVGIGISQLLPVVVAALDAREPFVAIEQPELHVHPALQTELGDLLVEAVGAIRLGNEQSPAEEDHWFTPDPANPGYKTNSRILLVETHSEHLILRLLRRMRELAEGTLKEGDRIVLPSLLGVYYAEPTDDGVRLHHLRVDESGEFIDRWPEGFFAERRKELF
ncbi:AAA family ATPase [Sphingomonas sp. GCM10030256]|uniref:AAA family ATPase n=1 Tax=Sphingomonas sp. GCM10030256 TaxID=3273427 RepID=UPI003621B163